MTATPSEPGHAQFADNMRGALLMTASMAGFALNDGMIKMAMQSMPLFPAILLRGVLTCVILVALCLVTGAFRARPARRDRRLIGLRCVAEVGGTLCFLTALNNMPIASASAILQSLPLAVTLAAALFMGEQVGWRRGAALVVGFLGVLLIVRPGADSFNAYALSALGAVFFIVARDLTTRGISREIPSTLVALITAVTITGVAGIGSLFTEWPPITVETLGWTSAASCFLIVGYLAGVATMRVGEIAFVAPFRYSILLVSIVIGIVMFDEVPDAMMLAGSVLIVGSGMFTFWRERRVAASIRASAQPPTRT